MQLAQNSSGTLVIGVPCDASGNLMTSVTLADFALLISGSRVALNAAGSVSVDGEGNVSWNYTASDTAAAGQLQVLCVASGYAMQPLDFFVGLLASNANAIISALAAAGLLQQVPGASSSSGQTEPALQFTPQALAQQPINAVNIDSGTTIINSDS